MMTTVADSTTTTRGYAWRKQTECRTQS